MNKINGPLTLIVSGLFYVVIKSDGIVMMYNQRGGARDMALHLLKDENDHVQVYEIDGFSSESLLGAFKEVHAISKATRCRQFLYSLSVNPPPGKDVSTSDFVKVIDEGGRGPQGGR